MTIITALHSQKSSPAPFARVALPLVEMGFCPLPIEPGAKRPGEYRGTVRGWSAAYGWQAGEVAGWQLGRWCRWPDAGVGVRHSDTFIAIDFDAPGEAELESKVGAFLDTLPGVVVARRGAKGFARYFRADGTVATAQIKARGVQVLDVLAAGRQSVIPPSRHPAGMDYVWLTPDTLVDTPLSALPLLTSEHVIAIRALVAEHFGVEEADLSPMPRHDGERNGNDPLGDRALSNLDLWVPALGLVRLERLRGRFAAVAHWRPSTSGQPLERRKRNLSISPYGIKDFGDDRGYSPIGLVMVALRLPYAEARLWLARRVGDVDAVIGWEPGKVPARAQPTLTADEVAIPLREAVRRFLEEARDYSDHPSFAPPQALARVSLGAGKSFIAAREIAAMIARESWRRVLVRVPDHRLAAEWQTRLESMLPPGRVAVWRGSDQPDPDAPGERMCRAGALVSAVKSVGGSRSDVCRTCPFFPRVDDERPRASLCGYQLQGHARMASVVIVAGDVSLASLPKTILRSRLPDADGVVDRRPDFDAIVLDETSPTNFVKDGHAALDVLAIDLAGLREKVLRDDGQVDEPAMSNEERANLDATLACVRAVLAEAVAAGRLTPDMLARHGRHLGPVALDEAARLVWRFKPRWRPTLIAGRDPEMIRAMNGDRARLVAAIRSLGKILRVIGQADGDARHFDRDDALPHVLSYVDRKSDPEHPRQMLSLQSRQRLDTVVERAPVLILDATADEVLLRPWFAGLRVLADLEVRDGAGVHRIQITGTSGSAAGFAVKAGSPDHGRQLKNVARLSGLKGFAELAHGGACGLICHKSSADFLRDQGMTDVMHFGATRGLNDFEDARAVIVGGRVAAAVDDVERMASVIAGRPVQKIKPDQYGRKFMPKVADVIHMRDGSTVPTTAERHPDPLVEAVRASVTDSERRQAMGRGRAIRRGEDRPLLEIIVGDGDTGAHVDAVVDWTTFKALTGWIGQLLAAGVWPTGQKPAQMRAHALGACSSAGSPIRPIYGIRHLSDSRTATEFFRNQASDNPAQAALVGKTDAAVGAAEPHIELLPGLPMPLGRTLNLRADGDRYATPCAMRDVSTWADAIEAADQIGAEVAYSWGDVRKGKAPNLPSGILIQVAPELVAAIDDETVGDDTSVVDFLRGLRTAPAAAGAVNEKEPAMPTPAAALTSPVTSAPPPTDDFDVERDIPEFLRRDYGSRRAALA